GRKLSRNILAMAGSSTRSSSRGNRIYMAVRTAPLWQFRQPSVIPGFGLALGVTLAWLVLIILIPLSGLAWRSSTLGWATFLELAAAPSTVNAPRISFRTALAAELDNVVFGVILA